MINSIDTFCWMIWQVYLMETYGQNIETFYLDLKWKDLGFS